MSAAQVNSVPASVLVPSPGEKMTKDESKKFAEHLKIDLKNEEKK